VSACSWAGRHGVAMAMAMAMAAEVVRAGWSLFGWPAAACLPISAPPRGRRWRQRVDHGERGCGTSGSGGRPRTRAALAADAELQMRGAVAHLRSRGVSGPARQWRLRLEWSLTLTRTRRLVHCVKSCSTVLLLYHGFVPLTCGSEGATG
jgi:hypothetical protein